MNQQVTFDHYQEKGFKLFDKIRDLEDLTARRNWVMMQVETDIKMKEELEQWEQQVKNTGKKVLSSAKTEKTCELQDKHYKNFTPYERISAILKDDYNNQKFNGRGKRLLIEEIEKLKPTIKTFSLSKENKKNKALLKTMTSLVEKLAELEKMQQELRSPQKATPDQGQEIIASTGKRKIESSDTKQEPKQKALKNDMFSQREQQFKTRKSAVVSPTVKEHEESTIRMEEMDGLEGSRRNSISI
ncbi:hypothetical protein [Legionella maioricensis]|uniref:Uncharacterized protein n=1 Tax=Legionella maioricensis TaxID=2896528 RepID=A0A9X2IBI7_9GAMM|nr:hypothetical protein [Legionella maioricensis]MCL9684485.1 hypothetical protein [Legionella maioricensis]MCL9687921.1 hypothetical protein [Legionella maioricensis]